MEKSQADNRNPANSIPSPNQNCLVGVLFNEPSERIRVEQACSQLGWSAFQIDPDIRTSSRPHLDYVLFSLWWGGGPHYELIPTLRAQHVSSTLLVCSGFPSVRSAVLSAQLGADDYLPYPFTPAQLIAAARAHSANQAETFPLLPSLARIEWEYTMRTLDYFQHNISATARALGIRRSTLQRKLKKNPPCW